MASRLLILLVLLTVIDIYSFQWLKHLTASMTPLWRIILNVLFWSGSLVAGILMIFFLVDVKISPSVLVYLRAWAFISYFAKFLSIPFVFIDDLRRIFSYLFNWVRPEYTYNASRSKFLSSIGAVAAGIPFFTLFYGMARNAYRYRLHKVKLPIKDLPAALEGLRIVQISDIHSGSFTSYDSVSKSIDMVKKLQPDLLFFTGDLVNNRSEEVLPYIDIFQQMKGRYGSYSVLGNHDYGDYERWDSHEAKAKNLDSLKSHHNTIGWKLLLNANETIEVKGEKISIIGVENYSASHRFTKYGDLNKAYLGVPDQSFKLLLSHDPSHWKYEVTEKFKDIALTLSGHTHGFQFGVEIPGFKWSPSQYIYKEWAGLYTTDKNQHLYVNRGFGFLGYPGRVGILPEITLLELTTKA